MKKELVDAKSATEIARSEVEKMKEEENEKLKAADLKGYEAGIQRAALDYTRVARRMVNDELSARLPDFYRVGYKAGSTAMAHFMNIEPEQGFFKNVPEPVNPDLELPYTKEEFRPLPPEDDEDDGAAAEGRDKSGGNASEGEHLRRRRSWVDRLL